jgi:hypothetical protein
LRVAASETEKQRSRAEKEVRKEEGREGREGTAGKSLT